MLARVGVKGAVLGVVVFMVTLVMACGEEASPTPGPTAQPTAAVDVQSIVQQAVQQAIAAAPTPAPGISPEDIPSIEDISSLVQAAVAASVPEGTSAEQIRQMVQAAVAAAQAPGVTTSELQQVVAAAVDAAVAQAVSRITPVATPVASPTPGAMVAPTGTLNVGIPQLGVPIFDLSKQEFVNTKYESTLTHETMFGVDDDGLVIGRMVKEWSVDPTGLVYTLNLQEGVPWHKSHGDWGELNADDFIFSLERATVAGTPNARAGAIRRNFLCDECLLTKVNDLTLTLELPAPIIDLTWDHLPSGGLGLHSKKHFDAAGEDRALRESVGTGPWELIEARTEEFFKVRAVNNHWRQTPQWDEMIWWDIAEESTRVANFLTGELDTGAFSADSVQAIRQAGMAGVRFMPVPASVIMYVRLHGGQYYPDAPSHQPGPDGEAARVPLGEGADYRVTCDFLPYVSCNRELDSPDWERARKVRLAMTLSLDRQKLINNIALGEAIPSYLAFWFNPGRERQFGLDQLKWDFDPIRAKQLLTEAGYPDGFEVDLALTPQQAAGAIEAAKAVATMWEDIGIRTRQQDVPGSVFRPRRVQRTAVGIQTFSSPPSDPEPLRQYTLFLTSTSSFNQGFEHPYYEGLVGEAQSIVDDDARWAKQAEIARWMFDEVMAGGLPLYAENAIWPLGPSVGQWTVHPGQREWLNNWEYAPHR